MRLFACLLALFLVTEVAAQEPPPLWSKVQDVLSKFVPPQQPGERPTEQPLDMASAGESPTAERQTQWDSATKLTADEPADSDTGTAPQSTTTSFHPREKCLDPSKFQPGLAGYLDYYLFTVVDTTANEVYLTGEHSREPFCLTNVDTADLEDDEQVVILGNVRVRGTKVYKAADGSKVTVQVVKLLSAKESELVDAERALLETEHPMRTWTSKDGKHKVEARFVKFANGKVHLVNKAGKAVSISPNNLAVADRDYYRGLVKQARDAVRKKAEADDADQQDPLSVEERLR